MDSIQQNRPELSTIMTPTEWMSAPVIGPKKRPKMKSNLPRFLEDLLSNLRGMKQIIFASADKNLGPVAVTLEQYIKDALTHLSDSNTYEMLSSAEAEARDRDTYEDCHLKLDFKVRRRPRH